VLFILVFFRVYKETNKLRGNKKCRPLLQTIVSLMNDSLNNIRLTAEMIRALYGQSLVAPVDHTFVKKAAVDRISEPRVLGGNAKRVAIVVNRPGHTFVADAELAFLTKILGACGLNIGDVAIVNLAVENLAQQQLVDLLGARTIIYFISDSPEEFFKISSVNEVLVLHAPSLSEFSDEAPESRTQKTRLWNALKQLFGL
jgi:hypothetical protein